MSERLNRYADEVTREFRDEPLPPDVGRRLIERSFDADECVLLVAEEQGEVHGLCLTAPLFDPLTGESVPVIVLLNVESQARQRGLARALAEQTQRLLARRGHRRLAARAGHNDDALISMGERWGYLRHWELMLHEA